MKLDLSSRRLGLLKSAALIVLISFAPPHASATNILSDGTFRNTIGTSGNLTPWSDWTNAGVTTHTAPLGIMGNYASLPTGTDLFQRFDSIPNGTYELSFQYENTSSSSVHLVFAIQQQGGSPVSTEFDLGLAANLVLPASKSFSLEQFFFTLDNPPYALNEFTFSNSYDGPVDELADSVNPSGTIINVADVSISAYSPITAVPELSTWALMSLGFGMIGFFRFRKTKNTSHTKIVIE